MRIVDLSHAYADDMPLYPGLLSPSFHDFAVVERDGCAMSEDHLLNHIDTRAWRRSCRWWRSSCAA